MSLFALIELMRPWQWVKNLMIFFPPLLSGAMFHPGVAVHGLLPFLTFCSASSASYVFNDLVDHDRDVHHPEKRKRPLPAGRVSRPIAMMLTGVLFTVAVMVGWHISFVFLGLVLAYLLVSVSYSLYLKDWPIVDIFAISLGFVLRLYGGGGGVRYPYF